MVDLRPVGYVIGLLLAALGVSMLVPMGVDLVAKTGHWQAFLQAAVVTGLLGAFVSLACGNAAKRGLTIQQSFLLTTMVWAILPVFGALPFVFGATNAPFVDAMFEAMSGMTTTGSTVFSELERLPEGLLLWRSMLQWFGGIGIVVVAMVFLPELRVGGMQVFRSEGFDTMGKILPRATQISGQISTIYIVLTVLCTMAYAAAGQTFFQAINHAMTTVATGGFATSDASFAAHPGASEYIAVVFMIAASLPFVRYIQLVGGSAQPLLRDSQVRAFLWTLSAAVLILILWRIADGTPLLRAVREVLFNTTSLMTGTGYASADYQLWGPFAVAILFFLGLVGGCAGATCCSVKIFRYQILLSSIKAQIRRIHSPHGVFTPRFDGRPVSDDVLSSVMGFFVLFIVSIGLFAVALGATGLDMVTSISGAATAIANIGPGFGDTIGPTGGFGDLNATAKWLLIAAMLIGRLEIMSVFLLLSVQFWRAT
ncbi:MAG: TrkH family potassium uptake protein [Pseudomonadota bacterium]